MKKLIFLISSVLFANAPSPHNASLAWADALNPSGTTYNVYRDPMTCAAGPSGSNVVIATGLTVLTYVDSTIVLGSTYCYRVTAVVGGYESTFSNGAAVVFPAAPPAPTNLTGKAN